MGKILGSWSGMRKYLESEMLAESLHGRIRFGCTSYPGMDGCHVIEICVDGKQLKRFSWETVNTYFIDNGYKENSKPYGYFEYWQDFFKLLDNVPITERTEYTDEEFCEALTVYRNQDIKESINSVNPLVKMFALLDRRVGKRTLSDIKEMAECYPEWLKKIYELRISA